MFDHLVLAHVSVLPILICAVAETTELLAMSSNQKGRKSRDGDKTKNVTKKSVFDSLYNIQLGGSSTDANEPLEPGPQQRESSDQKTQRWSNTSRKSRKRSKSTGASQPRMSKPMKKIKTAQGTGRSPVRKSKPNPTPSSKPAVRLEEALPRTPRPISTEESTKKPKKSEAEKTEEVKRFLKAITLTNDISDLPEEETTEEQIHEALSGFDFSRHAEESEYRKLDKYHEFPPETIKQKLSRAKKEHEGKLDSAYGPLEIMNYQKKAIIKAAVTRARRHERVCHKLTRNWDSSSESEECIDCYAPKSVRKELYKIHASYHHGIKRTSLFATVVKWTTVLVGLYDYVLTYYILFRIYTYQMWMTYFRAKQQLNCNESIIHPYQIEVFYYCVSMINSVNLIFTLRRSNWRFLSYWLKTQLWLCILAPLPAFTSARFNAKNGNVGPIIQAQVIFHCLLVVKVGIVLYRLYMVRKPFYWRRLNWFIKAERDRQLNQDLDARNSSFIQKKNSYRNAFSTALYSVLKTLVDHYETKGKPLRPDEVGKIIKKYDETLNDITMYPDIEQYLRMAYIRFCIKRGIKDKRILARQTQFFKLRDERMKRVAMEKITEEKRRKRLQAEAFVLEPVEILAS